MYQLGDTLRAMSWFLYLIECRDGSLYTGITTDLARRLAEHQSGKGGHYTRAHSAKSIVYSEPHPDRSSASRREAAIKKLSREGKEKLVDGRASW